MQLTDGVFGGAKIARLSMLSCEGNVCIDSPAQVQNSVYVRRQTGDADQAFNKLAGPTPTISAMPTP